MPVLGGRQVGTHDVGVMGGGVAVLVFSFFPWFGLRGYGGGGSGWSVGGIGLLGVLAGVAAAVLVALRVFSGVQLPRLQVGWSVIVLAAAAAGALLVLLKLLIGYSTIIGGLDRKFGLYLTTIAVLAEAYFAFMAFRASGETLPGGRRL